MNHRRKCDTRPLFDGSEAPPNLCPRAQSPPPGGVGGAAPKSTHGGLGGAPPDDCTQIKQNGGVSQNERNAYVLEGVRHSFTNPIQQFSCCIWTLHFSSLTFLILCLHSSHNALGHHFEPSADCDVYFQFGARYSWINYADAPPSDIYFHTDDTIEGAHRGYYVI